MAVKIEVYGETVTVDSPYNPDFPSRARDLGGKWDGGAKVWTFDARDEERIRDLCLSIYGEDGRGPTETVDIRVTFQKDDWADRSGYYVAGRQVARATGRDSGAKLGGGVVLLAGAVDSGGSMKHWRTDICAGTVMEVRDVPRPKVEEELAKPNDYYTVEILEGPNSGVQTDADRRTYLKAQRAALVEKLADIDDELARLAEGEEAIS